MRGAAWFRSAFVRWLLLLVLTVWGLGYIGWFAYLIEHSRDFVARQRIEALCSAPASAATEFRFDAKFADRNMLASGWGTPEEWGIWSSESRTLLVLPVPAKVRPHGARLNFELLVPNNEKFPLLPVYVSVSGKPVASWWLREDNKNAFHHLDLSAADLRGRRCIEIGFDIVRPYRPIKEDLGPDARLLGVGLKRAIWQTHPTGVP